MPHFKYKARNIDGQPIDGMIEASSANAAAEQLNLSGITPVAIELYAEEVSAMDKLSAALGMDMPQRVDLILMTRQMYALTKAGVPITQGFRKIAQTTRNRRLGRTIESIVGELESGRELAGAMGHHSEIFSPLMISMVRVGEESGHLEYAFIQLNMHLEREQRTMEQVKTAIRYPMIVIGAIIVAVFILMTFVVPEFAKVYAGFNFELPLPTRILIATSKFFEQYWWLVIGGAALIFFQFRKYIRTDAGREKFDRQMLKVPVVGSILLRATLARFARSFSMCTKAGVPVLQTLSVVANAVGNVVISKHLYAMRSLIERGESVSRAAAAQGIFTPLVLQMLSVGEETGQVDEMLHEVAEFYEREVDYDVKNLNDLLQPFLTAIVAGLVLLLAVAIFLPMWDLVNLAKQG